ncbi:hypothetical protein FACS189440_06520 [Bacteroidia bacterium]|nr:hypothetical protein FACS189423_04940 [Bacteroidia bacterium]GHT47059.1 hypothetical protein FACS189440_06520 [Bacteroidia bacterium]
MVNQFPHIRFRYELKDNTHYIGVYPPIVEEDLVYCKAENDFYNLLSKKFPDETFLFGEEGFNFKPLKNPKVFEYEASSIIDKPVNFSFNALQDVQRIYIR